MTAVSIRLLLLEDNEGDARLVQTALAEHAPGEFAVTWVERLADALVRIQTERFEIVLCDLGLPDSSGLATIQVTAAGAPALPLVVLTGSYNEDLGREAILHGAQDYLVKGESSGPMIARTLRHAIGRKRLENELREANKALEHRVAQRTAELETALTKLHEGLSRARALAETTGDAIITADHKGTILRWNPAAERMFGYTEAEAVGQALTLVMPDRYRARHLAGMSRVQAGGERHVIGRTVELHGLTKAGSEFPIELSLSSWETLEGRMFGGIIRDITERKQAELALTRQKDLYDALSQTNQAIVRGAGREEMFHAICRIAVEHGHFRFSWIGLIDRNDKRVKPVAQYGEDAGYVKQLEVSIDETVPAGRGRTGQALRTGRPVVGNDFGDERAQPPSRNRDAARRAGVRAYGAFPIRQGGVVAGVINFYAAEAGFFTEDLIGTLEEMAQDLSFALDNFEREAERARAEQALAESEARYRSVFVNSNVTMLLIDPADGRIVDANYAACAYYGWDLPALQGMTIKDINTLSPEQVQANLDRVHEEQNIHFEFRHRLANGEVREVEIFSGPVEAGGRKLRLSVIHDVTERLRARHELAESEDRFRGLVEQSIAGIYIIQDGKFAYVNPRFAEILGYGTADELVGRDPLSTVADKDRGVVAENHRRRLGGEVPSIASSFTAQRKDGSTIEVGVHGARATHRGRPAIIGLMQDITESKRAQEALRESEARFRSLTEMSSDFYWESDAEHRLMKLGSGGTARGVPTLQEGARIGKRRWELPYLAPDEAGWQAHRAVLDARQPFRDFEFSRLDTDGTERHILVSGDPVFDASGAFRGYRGVGTDITERKRAEQALRESETRFRSLTEMSSDFYWESDVEHRFTMHISSGKSSQVWVSERGTQIGRRRWEIPHLSPDEAGWQVHRAVLEAHRPFRDFAFSRRGTDGAERHFTVSGDPIFDVSGAFKGYRGVGSDITERKRAEQALRAAEDQFRGLVEQSIAGIYIIQDGKFAYVNPRLAEILGYDSTDELVGRDLLSMVAEKDRGTVAENIRQRVEGEVRSISYSLTALREDGSTVEVGVHGARATYRGRPAIIGLMQDISEKKRAEEEIRHYVAQLETAFMSTVGVATTLSEMRDPYTAGHERRVAEIAVAIGAKLGFDARRLEGLRVAGHLHDVGKITIPSEILSKPGRLSPLEFKLIQGHAQASYDVLKAVEFPWPVAEVALQHHERIDGSGYPQGLKGEAILLEARIMAVADVIEAMSSHRPYRAGLGIEAALTEIERGCGTSYDAAVADACLKLFREKGYAVPA